MFDKEFFQFIGVMGAAFALLISGLLALDLTVRSYACENHAEMYETESEFRVFGGCYLERGGRMIRLDDYKYVELRADQ